MDKTVQVYSISTSPFVASISMRKKRRVLWIFSVKYNTDFMGFRKHPSSNWLWKQWNGKDKSIPVSDPKQIEELNDLVTFKK